MGGCHSQAFGRVGKWGKEIIPLRSQVKYRGLQEENPKNNASFGASRTPVAVAAVF